MKRLALLFIIAVMIPCSVLAWLAYRAMNEEQRAFKDQQIALAQEKTDALAARSQAFLGEQLREFERSVDLVLASGSQPTTNAAFNQMLQTVWPVAQSGFLWETPQTSAAPMVSFRRNTEASLQLEQPQGSIGLDVSSGKTTEDEMLRKQQISDGKANERGPENRPMAKMKVAEESNGRFVGGKDDYAKAGGAPPAAAQAVEKLIAEIEPALPDSVPTPKQFTDAPAKPTIASRAMPLNAPPPAAAPPAPAERTENLSLGAALPAPSAPAGAAPSIASRAEDLQSADKLIMDSDSTISEIKELKDTFKQESAFEFKPATPAPIVTQRRVVSPEHLSRQHRELLSQLSLHSGPLDLGQAVQSKVSGIQGRVTPEGKFSLLAWYRPARTSDTIFAAEIPTDRLIQHLVEAITGVNSDTFCLTILDHTTAPAAKSNASFQTDWKRPYVSSELGANLPQWEAAAYLLSPDALLSSGRAAQWKLGLMVLAVVAAALLGAGLLWFEARQRWLEARQKTDFVSQVSHELKTPLTSIRMFSDLLAQNSANPEPEKTQRYAAVISQEAGRLSRLINSVLDFSRLERGNLPMQCSPSVLQEIVGETLAHYRPHLESVGFSLTTTLPEIPLNVNVDADRISQIILNLLSNAEKYSGEGREIDVDLSSNGTTATLTVSDRGPGVPQGKEKRIFEKFFRAHDSLHSGIPGTGLGLSLAREIARAHHGDLIYQRRQGGGSQFVLTIPLG